jgi:hypothetical protein
MNNGAPMTRDEYIKKIEANPRFKKLGQDGQGFVIMGAKPHRPETLDDLTPLERKIIEQFLLDNPGTSPEEAIKDFRDQGL